jgi:hypothetical protein
MTIAGKPAEIPATIVFPNNNTKSVGLLDTGSQTISAPLSVVGDLWSQFPGAIALNPPTNSVWMLPCDKEPPAVTFVIGGQTIPLHPLDVNPVLTFRTSSGSLVSVCKGGIDASIAPQANRFDFLMGSPLLKNAYAMFNFPNSTTNASIKLLAMIDDPKKASADFAATRKAQLALAPPASLEQIMSAGDSSFEPVNGPSVDQASTTVPTSPSPSPSPAEKKNGAISLTSSTCSFVAFYFLAAFVNAIF